MHRGGQPNHATVASVLMHALILGDTQLTKKRTMGKIKCRSCGNEYIAVWGLQTKMLDEDQQYNELSPILLDTGHPHIGG